MKVNWGALSITIGLILVAASILAVGLMAEKRISELRVKLTTLEKQIPIIKADIERKIIAQEYTFSKAYSENRAITLEDLKEGHTLADKFMKR
ncbi:hypothetical protein CEE35_06320 [Candidatus Aerophobetes bacterium Ae_b3b]|nr:MAG: hypothetical protein CEE35_06320 [Candidatus Aerophobetes bacterium Ae_b3b]